LKIAISVGIGLFIALIGLVDSGFVRRTGAGPVPVTLGAEGTLVGWPIIVFAVGLFLMIALMVRKTKGALLFTRPFLIAFPARGDRTIFSVVLATLICEAIIKMIQGAEVRRLKTLRWPPRQQHRPITPVALPILKSEEFLLAGEQELVKVHVLYARDSKL
jgi:hypothetical protein